MLHLSFSFIFFVLFRYFGFLMVMVWFTCRRFFLSIYLFLHFFLGYLVFVLLHCFVLFFSNCFITFVGKFSFFIFRESVLASLFNVSFCFLFCFGCWHHYWLLHHKHMQ